MKRIFIFIIFAIALSVVNTNAQKAPKKSNTIIISTTMPADSCFDYIIYRLSEKGFPIAQINKKYGLLQTDGKVVKNSCDIKILCTIKKSNNGSKIILKGLLHEIELNMSGISTGEQWSEIKNSGMKGSMLKKSWDYIDTFAHTIPGKISYKKDS